MKIVIATPLFPPDVEDPAPYVKTLAAHLSAVHDVTVVLYGTLPESVPGVHLVPVDKRTPLLQRLVHYTRTLILHARTADTIIAENGPSLELPLLIASLITRTPYILHHGDIRASVQAKKGHPLRGLLARLATMRAAATLTTTPPPRPEMLPFAPPPTQALQTYETAWTEHVAAVEHTLHHA